MHNIALIRSRKSRTEQRSASVSASRQPTLLDDSDLPELTGHKPLTPAILLKMENGLSNPPSVSEIGKGKKTATDLDELSSSPQTLDPMQSTTTQPRVFSSSPKSSPVLSPHRPSFEDFPSPEVLIRRDSQMSQYSPVPEKIMGNLSGVTM